VSRTGGTASVIGAVATEPMTDDDAMPVRDP
jgi:hypothetical protein